MTLCAGCWGVTMAQYAGVMGGDERKVGGRVTLSSYRRVACLLAWVKVGETRCRRGPSMGVLDSAAGSTRSTSSTPSRSAQQSDACIGSSAQAAEAA